MEIHRCRFYEFEPQPINKLAFDDKGILLAVARANSDIEIWNAEEDWVMQQVLPGTAKGGVEGLAWVGQRLFSAGLQGQVTEWCLRTMQAKSVQDSQGGAVWCLAASPDGTRLAVGCEDGHVRLFSTEDNQLLYSKTLDQGIGRVVSVAWHASSETIVSGSSRGTIHVWDVQTGRSRVRINLEKTDRKRTVVWQVNVLRDMTIVSADSTGAIQFWEGRFGTLQQSISSHDGELLALAVNQDEDKVYASGMDSKVALFSRVTVPEDGGSEVSTWVQAALTRSLDRDVRALALAPSPSTLLVAGGVDTTLVVYDRNHIEGRTKKILPFLHGLPVSLAPQPRMVLCQYPRTLQLWKLGTGTVSAAHSLSSGEVQSVPLTAKPRLLLEVRPKIATHIVCSNISPCGTWLALSDMYTTKIYQCTRTDSDSATVHRVKHLPFKDIATHSLAFATDSSFVVLAGFDGTVRVAHLPSMQVLLALDQHATTGPVIRVAVSEDSQWLATGDVMNNIFVVNLKQNKPAERLPGYSSLHTCFAFQPKTNHLMVCYSDQAVIIYDPESLAMTPWSRSYSSQFPERFAKKHSKNISVVFDPASPDLAMIADHRSFSFLDLSQSIDSPLGNAAYATPQPHWSRGKWPRVNESSENGKHVMLAATGDLGKQLYTVTRYQPLVFFGAIGPQEMIAIERPWLDATSKLPAPIVRHRYGT